MGPLAHLLPKYLHLPFSLEDSPPQCLQIHPRLSLEEEPILCAPFPIKLRPFSDPISVFLTAGQYTIIELLECDPAQLLSI